MDQARTGIFSPAFADALEQLMRWRRDVRHFRTDPVPDDVLGPCLRAMTLAPSVGLSEPWVVVRVDDPATRDAMRTNFERANQAALAGYDGERAQLYARLKLSGMREAPVQLAVFCDEATAKGHGLGAATMPETRRYSVVAAVQNFWLAARARGLGVGWVSILDPAQVRTDLKLGPGHEDRREGDPRDGDPRKSQEEGPLDAALTLVAYLCVGWPARIADAPELERAGWERRAPSLRLLQR